MIPISEQANSLVKSRTRQSCRIFWLCFFTLGAFVAIGYGSFRLHTRNDLDCPIPPPFQNTDFPDSPIRIYSTFCNPANNDPIDQKQPAVDINVTAWCNQLGCGGQPPNQQCLLYTTGDPNGPCSAKVSNMSAPCALSCQHSVRADFAGGTALVVIGIFILIVETSVLSYHYVKGLGIFS